MDYVTLNNGTKMPILGLGTWKSEGEDAYQSVLHALKIGYRYIDTAAVYGNEEAVGNAIKDSGIPREELFIVTKLWNSEQGYEKTKVAFQKSLERLQLDYVDLYLIHWPKSYEQTRSSYKAMEELYDAGKVKAIGVSNFNFHHLEHLLKDCMVKPTMNQVECHVQFQNQKLQSYCEENDILLTAYAPMMSGKIEELLQNEVLMNIAKKYQKTAPQVALRWLIERGIVVIPKSIKKSRIKQNFDVFDFSLDSLDHEEIRQLNTGVRIFPDPDNIDF